MSNQFIKITVTVKIDDEKKDPKKMAQLMREGQVGRKVQDFVAHIVGANATECEIVSVENEEMIHVCDWYEEDECEICRYSSSYSLDRTRRSLIG